MTSPIRLEPVSRYLFRRAAVVPALAGMAVCVAMPCVAPFVEAQSIKGDSGSMGPIVSIVSPEYSQVLKGEVQIVLGVQPRRYPAESVELFVDGRSITGVLPLQTRFKWKTDMFVDGPHTLTVRVTDTQGFVGQSETNIFINNDKKRVDVTAPILNWVNIQNGAKLSGEVKVRLEARDDFGVKYVFLRLNSAITPDSKPPLASWMTNRPPYEFKLDTSKYADGLYVLDAYTWDDQENEESAPRLTVGFYNHNVNTTQIQELPAIVEPQQPAKSGEDNAVKSGDSEAGNTNKSDNINKSGTNNQRVAQAETPNVFVAPAIPTVSGVFNVPPAVAPAFSSNSSNSLNAEHGSDATYIATSPVIRRENAVVRPSNGAANLTAPPKTPTMLAAGSQTPRGDAPAAVSVQSADALESQLTSSTTSSALEVLPGERPVAVATKPSLLPRFAAVSRVNSTLSPGGETNLQIGAPTVISGGFEASSVISARVAPDSTRIASVLPDEMATPPAQTIWQQKISPAVSGLKTSSAFATTLPTSPNTHLTTGPGATLDAARSERLELGTAPSVVGIIEKSVNDSQQPKSYPVVTTAPTAPVATTVESETAVRITQNTSPALVSEPIETEATIEPRPAANSNLSAYLLPTPASQQNKSERLAAIAAGAERATTRIAFAPIQSLQAINVSTQALATLPRVARLPEFNRSTSVPQPNAAIVVSPLQQKIEMTSFTAAREESLAAIANRFKMPLSVVAAANGLAPNARILKGTTLSIPRSIQVSYKGQAITGDVAPLLIGQTSVGAFRFIFEQQGGTLNWDAEKQQVTAKNDKYEVTLTVGSDKAVVNNKEEMMDMAAFLLSGRTMVPIRFFESALNAKVEWEPSTGRIYVAASQ